MLEKSMYDSWESRIRLFIKRRKHGKMMLDSINNGPLVYPTVEENGQTRPMKYSELTEAQQLQDDCDVQATNIIFHGLPPDVYALVNHQEADKDIWDRQGKDPIECINKEMAFLSAVASRFPPSNNQLRTSSNPRNQATIQDSRVTVQQVQGRETQSYAGTGNRGIATTSKGDYAAGQPRVVMANLLSCDPEVLSQVPYSDSYPNHMINQDVQEMQYSEQTHIDDFQDNEIHSDSNIIPYSQYLQES
ncbi:hypothetical protein Tco_0553951 [Tanacetum coccineum]